MNQKEWIADDNAKLQSIIADEAKNAAMLDDMLATLKQLRAKSTFRLALCHQLQNNLQNKTNKE